MLTTLILTLWSHTCRILQGLNRFLDLVPLDNETDNTTFTQNNFGLIALQINNTDTLQAFSANLGPAAYAVSTNETISPEQLLVASEVMQSATGALSPQGLGSCSLRSGSRRIAYTVFRTDALFLTPETACERFTVGSVILGVRIPNSSECGNTLSVIVNLQQVSKVCNIGAISACMQMSHAIDL